MPIQLVPRPFRDILDLRSAVRTVSGLASAGPGSAQNAILGVLGGGFFTRQAGSKVAMAAVRTAAVALAGLALYAAGSGVTGAALALSSVVSLPVTALAVGGFCLYKGAALSVAAIGANSLSTLGYGLALAAGGFATLEFHDILPFGLMEPFFSKVAEPLEEPLINAFAR